MATAQFEARVRDVAGVAVLDLEGEIDAGAEEALESAYAAAEDAATILLNFGGVDYINSTGIALIVGLLARARKNRQTVTACGLSDHYREIFQITRLADFMTIFDDERSALAEGSEGRE